MIKIHNLHAIEILDSRGNPTLKTTVFLENGVEASASVPSGASTGKHEAFELRDNDHTRYLGKGVKKAVENVNHVIVHKLRGMPIDKLSEIDDIMIALDATPNKSNLGANAILSVSLACMKAYALSHNMPLWDGINEYYFKDTKPHFPRLMINVINGGRHAAWNFDFQEFIIIPRHHKPSVSLRMASEIFHTLGALLEEEHYSTLKGDEGGYSPLLESNEQALSLITQIIKKLAYKNDVDIGMDCAASEFYKNNEYHLKLEKKTLSTSGLITYYKHIKEKYDVVSFEDPIDQDDWNGYKEFRQELGFDTLVVGDDLYTTNIKRLEQGIKEDSTNAILIKPNQIGTLSETVRAIKMAKEAHMKVAISHRSGETEDSFIADLAFACAADFLKSGSVSRSERVAKYNRLLEIEELEFEIK